MGSVTRRAKEAKQPRGGYIPAKEFSVKTRDDGIELKQTENIHASLVGLAVDYLTRFMMGAPLEEAFEISLLGASIINKTGNARKLLKEIRCLDNRSITNACKLTGYDVCFRTGIGLYKPVQAIEPDENTIFNVRTMVNRSINFWEEYGPIVESGFTFEGGYTNIVSSGDGDYLTKDTLWDFKVSKYGPRSSHTLQLLMYYIMGCHTIKSGFKSLRYIGIFNPRLNSVYLLDITKINPEVIDEVSCVVIGYSDVDRKFNASNESKHETCNIKVGSDDWLLNDLVSRYDVSRTKITRDFFSYGLPYYRVGRVYHFSPDDVMQWEIAQKYIPYGKNQRITLPAYIECREFLKSEIRKAKKIGDKERVFVLKQDARNRNISLCNVSIKGVVTVVLMALTLIILLEMIEH